MNVQFANPGSSFKGAMAYYTHDKGEPGERLRTSERMAWAETRNLATDRPEVATRLMIATAQDADRLKREAGIRATGRKATKPVMAYSLAWHPSEAGKLDRSEMVRAANDSLRVLGLEKHQAVIVAHRDTAHPHVHVIVNRVSPEDGRMATISPKMGRELARDWAHRYEQARGQIVSPQRAATMERIADSRRKHPELEKRKEHVRLAQAEARRAPPSRTTADARASRAQQLRERGQEQNARHSAEWGKVRGRYAARKDEIYRTSRDQMKDATAAHKADTKAIWADHFRQERADRKELARMERTPAGLFSLAVMAARVEQREGSKAGIAALVFRNIISKAHRDSVCERAFERDRKALASHLRGRLDDKLQPIITRRGDMLEQAKKDYDRQRAELKERQAPEKLAMREAWRDLRTRDTRAAPQRPQEARTASQEAQDRAKQQERVQQARTPPQRPQEARSAADKAREDRQNSPFGWLDRQKAEKERLQQAQERGRQERQPEERGRSAFDWLDKSQQQRQAEQRERATREQDKDRGR